MKRKSYKQYSREFKLEAIRLAEIGDKTASQVARELGIRVNQLYRALARRIVGTLGEPVILVDWTDLNADRRWQLLRAAVPAGGRALTLYEEIHPLRHFANPRVHRAFLVHSPRWPTSRPACSARAYRVRPPRSSPAARTGSGLRTSTLIPTG